MCGARYEPVPDVPLSVGRRGVGMRKDDSSESSSGGEIPTGEVLLGGIACLERPANGALGVQKVCIR